MRKLLLAVLILCGTLSARSEQAQASGAIVVFLQVNSKQFFMTSAIRDKAFNSSILFNKLEAASDNLYVARITPRLYNLVSYYGMYDYDVELNFDSYEKITFHYYRSLEAFIGVTENDETVVLLPQLAKETQEPIKVTPEACDEDDWDNSFFR